jgi:hypothetical protein
MVPLMAILFHLCILALVANVHAAPWDLLRRYVVTSYFQLSVTTLYPGYTITDVVTMTPDIETDTVPVIPTQTPFPSPVSAFTTLNDEGDVTIVGQLVTAGAPVSPVTDPYGEATGTEWQYYVTVNYPTPVSCAATLTSWDSVKTVMVSVPMEMRGQLPVITTSTVTESTYFYYSTTSVSVFVSALVEPSVIAADAYSSASELEQPYTPSACTPTPKPGSGNHPYQNGCGPLNPKCYDCTEWEGCWWGICSKHLQHYFECPDGLYWITGGPLYGKTALKVGLGVFGGWAGDFILLGIWESWRSFQLLAVGKASKRGVPVLWGCICCLPFCLAGPYYEEKPDGEDKTAAVERWNSTSRSKKVWLWLLWGFRRKYPPFFGDKPERRHRAKREAWKASWAESRNRRTQRAGYGFNTGNVQSTVNRAEAETSPEIVTVNNSKIA